MPHEEVATEAEVTLEVSDAWFDGCPSAEACPSLAYLIRGVVLFGNSRGDERCIFPMGSSPVAPIRNGHSRRVTAEPPKLRESFPERVTIIVVFRKTVGTKDHPTILAYKHAGLGSKLVLLVLLALGEAVNMRLVQGIDLVCIFPFLGEHTGR